MHHPRDKMTFVMPVVNHWLEYGISASTMWDRSDSPGLSGCSTTELCPAPSLMLHFLYEDHKEIIIFVL